MEAVIVVIVPALLAAGIFVLSQIPHMASDTARRNSMAASLEASSGPVVRSDRTNVLTILSLVLCGSGLIAVILGHVALKQIERTGEQGRGLALAGLIIGYIGLGIAIVYFAIMVAFSVNVMNQL